jgi:TRAP transporter 4TM/12TM fusion protein
MPASRLRRPKARGNRDDARRPDAVTGTVAPLDLPTDEVGLAASQRPRPRTLQALVDLLGGAVTVVAVLWAFDLPQRLGWQLYTEQFLALLLALTLGLTYLIVPSGRRRGGAPFWYDAILAVVGLLAALYVAVRYPALVNELVLKPWDGVLIGAILILLVLEGTRRTCGWTLVIVVLVFVAYALWGDLVPGRLAGRPVLGDRLAVYLAMDPNGILGTSLLIAATVVIAFILMGQVLTCCGGADYFNDVSLILFGRARGGSAKITIVSSLLFGTISGSAVANTVSSGVMTIPLMKKSGYPGTTAAAVEAVSSTGGQLVPPVMGAAAFLMAEYLQVPYSAVALAAVFPALFYYLSLYVWVDLDAGRAGYKPVPASEIPPVRQVLRDGWHFPIPFTVLIVTLFWLNYSPDFSALLASAILVVNGLLFGYRGKRMRLRDVVWSFTSTGAAVIDVLLICAAAGLVIGILNLTGLAFGLTLMLVQLGGQSVIYLLVMAAIVSTVLGMGMPTVGVYVLLATLIGPAMIKAGVDPIAGHMFLLYFGMMSMITPPVALAAYAAASIAQADFWKTGWECIRMGWTAYIVPFIFVYEPGILLKGDPWLAAWQIASCGLGIYFGTAGLFGYLFERLGRWQRLVMAASGITLLMPMDALTGGYGISLAGLVVGGVVFAREALAHRRRSVATTPA